MTLRSETTAHQPLTRRTNHEPTDTATPTAPDEAQKELLRRVAFQAEKQTLRRVRVYLARGRPLAGPPLMALRAQ